MHTFSQSPADIVALHFSILLQVAKFGCQGLEGVAAHKGGITLSIRDFLFAMVHLFVEQLAGQVAKHRSCGVLHRRQLVDKVQIGVTRILLEAIGNCRHVQQIIGPKDDKFGIIDAIIQTRAHQIELHIGRKEWSQMRPVATHVSTSIMIAHLHLLNLFPLITFLNLS